MRRGFRFSGAAVAVPTDEFFSDVELLIHPTGATFLDASSHAREVTLVGAGLLIASDILPTVTGVTEVGKWAVREGSHLEIGAAADWKFLHDGTVKWSYQGQHQIVDNDAISGVFSTCNGSTSQTGVYCAININRTVDVFIFCSVIGELVLLYTSSGFWPDDQSFHALQIDYDPALGADNLVCYVDGVSIGTATKTAQTPDAGNPQHVLTYGSTTIAGSNTPAGRFAEARITSTILRSHTMQDAIWPDA